MGTGGKIATGVALVALLGLGGWYLDQRMESKMEQTIHDYILAHPEILPEAMENLRKKDAIQRLASVRSVVETPFPGAILGNPDGKVTLVEFSDFACGYCRHSLPDVQKLIAENPDLRVVVRELPIISPLSPDAAKMGLAAATQGKFAQFHDAMFAAGQLDPDSIEAAARKAGLDMEKARAFVESPEAEAELNRNMQLANQLGFSGTPSWVIGDDVVSGAVGYEALNEAVSAARKS